MRSGMIKLVWNRSAMLLPVFPLFGSTPLFRFEKVRSPSVMLVALPALSCQVWKCIISDPPVGLCTVALKFSALTVSAQNAGGRIIGNVTDQSGAAVPGATVTVTNTGTQISQKVVTEELLSCLRRGGCRQSDVGLYCT